ncbi:hypothetical protein V6N13_003401 [Hibiscus sabdariffa]
MVDADGDWKWELLRHRLPTPVLLRIAAIQRPKPSFPMDSIGWKLGDDKKFSICTAYHVRCGEEVNGVDLAVIFTNYAGRIGGLSSLRLLGVIMEWRMA